VELACGRYAGVLCPAGDVEHLLVVVD